MVARGIAWLLIVTTFCGSLIILGGVSGSQNQCGETRRAMNQTLIEAAELSQGYLSPQDCDTYYSLTWYIIFYQIVMSTIAAVLVGRGIVSSWRYGIIGLLMPVFYLTMATCNAYYYQMKTLDMNTKSPTAVFAGAVITSVSNAGLIMMLGIRDEDRGPVCEHGATQ